MVVVVGRGWGRRRNGEIHLTESKTITALLLNDSPNRLKQRLNNSLGDARTRANHRQRSILDALITKARGLDKFIS